MKTKKEAEIEARGIINGWSAAALLGGWIPGSSLVFTGADLVMINQIADAFDVKAFDQEAAMATISGAIVSGTAGAVIAEGVGIIPVFGWAVKSAMMSVKARAIGEAVIDYFRNISSLPDKNEDK
jgi:hypothetical protein